MRKIKRTILSITLIGKVIIRKGNLITPRNIISGRESNTPGMLNKNRMMDTITKTTLQRIVLKAWTRRWIILATIRIPGSLKSNLKGSLGSHVTNKNKCHTRLPTNRITRRGIIKMLNIVLVINRGKRESLLRGWNKKKRGILTINLTILHKAQRGNSTTNPIPCIGRRNTNEYIVVKNSFIIPPLPESVLPTCPMIARMTPLGRKDRITRRINLSGKNMIRKGRVSRRKGNEIRSGISPPSNVTPIARTTGKKLISKNISFMGEKCIRANGASELRLPKILFR